MAVAHLLLVVSISSIVIRIGAVALERAVIRREHAKFQALSAFTNAGSRPLNPRRSLDIRCVAES